MATIGLDKLYYAPITESASGASGQTVINIYPQSLDEATVDYLFTRFNARLGAAI